jgi:hypothetical protein
MPNDQMQFWNTWEYAIVESDHHLRDHLGNSY